MLLGMCQGRPFMGCRSYSKWLQPQADTFPALSLAQSCDPQQGESSPGGRGHPGGALLPVCLVLLHLYVLLVGVWGCVYSVLHVVRKQMWISSPAAHHMWGCVQEAVPCIGASAVNCPGLHLESGKLLGLIAVSCSDLQSLSGRFFDLTKLCASAARILPQPLGGNPADRLQTQGTWSGNFEVWTSPSSRYS